MKYLATILFICSSFLINAQDTLQGCLFLDFENIEDLDIFEGFEISDQFEDAFGLTFSLEGGGFPVLAEVGGNPAAAYGSAWGNDTPDPQDAALVGSFFLTDDGILAGLDSPPIILDFATPIDSFAGCIMDMDFNEVFKIEAFDDVGTLILEDSIMAGDPGTGDGRAACFGFNLEGCTGTVSRIRYSGFRETAGAFGLGLDNFSFCFAGLAGTEEFVICESDSVIVNGEVFDEAGIFEQNLISSEGCDSLIFISIEELPEFDMAEAFSFCDGESVVVNGIEYTEEGVFTQEMQTVAGCDSILTVDITVFDTFEIGEQFDLCEGDSVIVNGEIFTTAGVFEQEFLTVDGCDSIVNIQINLFESFESMEQFSICEGDSVIVNGEIFTEAGNFVQEMQTASGCDSITNIEIELFESFESLELFDLCPGDSIIFENTIITESGSFEVLLQTQNGCDSLLVAQVQIFDEFFSDQSFNICSGDSLTVDGITYNEAGVFVQDLTTVNGCDSIISIEIIELETFQTDIPLEFCEGDSAVIGNVTYFEAGDFTQSLTASNGCDSTLNVSVNVLPASDEIIMFTIIEGDFITVNGENFDIAGEYEQLLEASNGCDSILIILLEVLPPNPEVFLEFEIADCTAGTDFSEFTPDYPVELECATVTASRLTGFSHSCTPGIDASGALCVSSQAGCAFSNNSENTIAFNLNLESDAESTVVITELSFYEQAPETFEWTNGQTGLNNYPTRYALRILRDNVEVFREINITTEREWNREVFDFTGLPEFRIEDSALYRVELTPYCTVENGSTVRAWDIDQIEMQGFCTAILSTVQGRISDAFANSPLGEVQLVLKSEEESLVVTSDVVGRYNFEEYNSTGPHSLTAYDNEEPLEDVSTLDLVLLQKHILGIKPFENLAHYIAGDINNSQSITAIDLIELRKVILGINESFPNNTSWRFHEADKELVLPFVINEEIHLEESRDVNWKGIKIGNLNESSFKENSASNRSSLGLEIQEEKVGEQFNYHFVSTEELSIDGLQMELEISNIEGVELVAQSLDIAGSEYVLNAGNLKIAYAREVRSIEEGSVLFSLSSAKKLSVERLTGLNQVYLSGSLEVVNISLEQNSDIVEASLPFRKLSVFPIPINDLTQVVFHHSLNETGVMSVIDMQGRMVYQKSIDLLKGKNEISLGYNDFVGSGLFTLLLESGTDRITHKIIRIE
jgi:hypothetical protein